MIRWFILACACSLALYASISPNKKQRLFVPRSSGLGWSFNFANPYSWIVLFLLIAAAVL